MAIAILTNWDVLEVLQLGRRLVADGQWTALPLLKQAGDPELLELLDRIPSTGDADMLHHLGGFLPQLCEGRGNTTAPLLLWLIEVTPCSFCRREGYEQLIACGGMPPDLAAEAAWDSE